MPDKRLVTCEDCGKQFKSYYILILHARYHRKESNYIFQRHSTSLQSAPAGQESACQAEQTQEASAANEAGGDAVLDSLGPLGSVGEAPDIFGESCSPPHLPNPTVDEEPRLVYMSEQELRRRSEYSEEDFQAAMPADEEEGEGEELECEICDARFTQVMELLKHIRVHRYELTESNYQQYRRKIVTTHRPAGVRVDLRRFPEDAGGGVGGFENSAETHKTTTASGTEYECDYCGKRFPTASNLKRHIPVHTGERPHQCPFCGCRFGDRSYMLKHTRFVHNVELARVQKSKSRSRNAKGSFKCQICDKFFENGDILAVHLEKYHSRPGKLPRPVDAGAEDEYPEDEEEELLIDTGVPAQPDTLYSCELCDFMSPDIEQLHRHLAEHAADGEEEEMAEEKGQQEAVKPKLTVTIADG